MDCHGGGCSASGRCAATACSRWSKRRTRVSSGLPVCCILRTGRSRSWPTRWRKQFWGRGYRGGGGSRGMRLGIRHGTAFDASGEFHLLGQCALDPRGGEAGCCARGDGGVARGSCGDVGALLARSWADRVGRLHARNDTAAGRRPRAGARGMRGGRVEHPAHRRPRGTRDPAKPRTSRLAGERIGQAHRLGHRHRRCDRTLVCGAGCHSRAADLFAPGDRLQSRPVGADVRFPRSARRPKYPATAACRPHNARRDSRRSSRPTTRASATC